MQNEISLENIKEYLRIIGTQEDTLLNSIKLGVMQYLENFISRGRVNDVFLTLPDDLKLSLLDHIAFLYDNRGSNAELPSRILTCYKKYKHFKLF